MGLQARLQAPGAQVGWTLSLYPEAGEGGGCFVSSRQNRGGGIRGAARDPERAAHEAARRARAKVRRYCATHRLNRLGTLTYAGEGCHDPRQVRSHVGAFFRQLRDGLGGEPMPYVWVPEWHKSRHGLHLHFAVGRYVPRGLIKEAWGRGFVHIKLLGNLPVGSGSLAQARAAAGYLSKYVTKAFTEQPISGLHRYDVAEGFQPKPRRLVERSFLDLMASASSVMGSRPALQWLSADVEDWQGPPAYWAQWA